MSSPNENKEFNQGYKLKNKEKLMKFIDENASMLTRTKVFKNIAKGAFEEMDVDNSGSISRTELHMGLLMVHLELSSFAGPAATERLSREQIDQVFDALDLDQSGELDLEEFTYVMMILCSHIFTRIAIMLFITLGVIPLVVSYVVKMVPYVDDNFIKPMLAKLNILNVVTELVVNLGILSLFIHVTAKITNRVVMMLSPLTIVPYVGDFIKPMLAKLDMVNNVTGEAEQIVTLGLSSLLIQVPVEITKEVVMRLSLPTMLKAADSFFKSMSVVTKADATKKREISRAKEASDNKRKISRAKETSDKKREISRVKKASEKKND